MGRDRAVQSHPRRGSDRADGPHVYQRGAVWWAYLGDGRRVSLRTKDAAEAERRFGEHLAAGRARAPRAAAPTELTLAELAQKYVEAPHGWSKRNSYTTKLRAAAFVEAMHARGVVYASRLTNEALDHWRAERMTTTARATINRGEVVARAMLAWCAERGLCAATPLARRKLLREPKRTRARLIPSPATIRRVIAGLRELAAATREVVTSKHAGPRHRAHRARAIEGAALALETGLIAGLRLDELRHLRPEHVDPQGVSVVPEAGAAAEAWATKSYRERRIPLTREAAARVAEFARWRGVEKPHAMPQSWLDEVIVCGALVAEVPPFHPHDLRRAFATNAVRAGVAITIVREWLGHRDVATTERYLGRYAEDALVVAPGE